MPHRMVVEEVKKLKRLEETVLKTNCLVLFGNSHATINQHVTNTRWTRGYLALPSHRPPPSHLPTYQHLSIQWPEPSKRVARVPVELLPALFHLPDRSKLSLQAPRLIRSQRSILTRFENLLQL